jgi:hypothetical protein
MYIESTAIKTFKNIARDLAIPNFKLTDSLIKKREIVVIRISIVSTNAL